MKHTTRRDDMRGAANGQLFTALYT